jgi:hypothetical protein
MHKIMLHSFARPDSSSSGGGLQPGFCVDLLLFLPQWQGYVREQHEAKEISFLGFVVCSSGPLD